MKIDNATYLSPNLRYDPAAREVVFERLNPETGDVTFQVPSRQTLREEEHAVPAPAAEPSAASQQTTSNVTGRSLSILV